MISFVLLMIVTGSAQQIIIYAKQIFGNKMGEHEI